MGTWEFSKRDLNAGKIVTPAWYRMKIEEVTEKPSKDQQSTNWVTVGTIIANADDGSTEFAEVPITWNFNSKALGFARGFLEALGITAELGKRYDPTAAVGQVLDVFVENGTYDGRIVNRVEHKYRKAQ